MVSAIGLSHALVTLNPGNVPGSSGGGTQLPSQNKVLYAAGYWWTFWGSAGGTNGIYYQSSPDGVTWTAPATFTNAQNPTNGGAQFDTYLVGTTLYYAVAPKTSGTNLWWGAATLCGGGACGAGNDGKVSFVQAGDAKDLLHNLPAGRIGTSNFRVSITIDGNNYLTIATTTSSNPAATYYVDVFQCQSATLTTCPQAVGAPWYTWEYLLQTAAVGDLTAPSLIPLNNGGTHYDALAFDDASSAAGAPGYGPFKVFIATSTAGSLPFPAPASPTCSPASQFYNEYDIGTAGSGSTLYVADSYFGGATYAFDCPVGGPSSAESPINANSYILSLGFYGATLVAAYAPCSSTGIAGCTSGNIATLTTGACCSGATVWTAGPNVAQNTEVNAGGGATGDNGEVDISPINYATTVAACPPQNCMGVMWIDGNNVRFATLSFTNFPVTVTLELREHQTPQTAWYPLTPSNEFKVSYTQCTNAPLCTSTAAANAFYGSCDSVIGSCTTASPAYGDAMGATDGGYIIITNVESYTGVTIAATSTGSGALEEWCLNISGANGACAATTFGSSNGIPAFVTVGGVQTANYQWYGYYDLLANPSKYTVLPAAPAPPSTPTIHIITAPTTSGATFASATYNNNQNAATVTYWIERNSTDFASASIAGVSSDQWAANPGGQPPMGCLGVGGLAWTVTSADQINCNMIYYHQYLNLFTVLSGGSQKFDGTGSFVIYGTQYGQFKIAIATYVPTGVSSYGVDIWTDAATSAYFTPAFIGAGFRWQACPIATCPPAADMDANATTTKVINTGVGANPGGYSITYFKQYSQQLAWAVSDGSTMPVSPPTISFTAFGVAKNPALNLTSSTVWMDAATLAQVTQTYCTGACGAATERWYTPEPTVVGGPFNGQLGWVMSASNVVTNPQIIWYHQFQQNLVYATSDGSAVHGAPASVTITYYFLGVQRAHVLNLTANVDWLDATKQVFVQDPIMGALPTEQWTVAPATNSWPSISGANQISNPVMYNHQFQVTFSVNPPGTGSIEANSQVVVLSSPIWEPAGLAGTFPIVANGISGYSFAGWTEIGSITIAAAGNPSTTSTVTGAGTITATFSIVTGLGFVEQNIALTGPLWSVTVTAPAPIPNPGASGCVLVAGTTYTCSSNSQDIIITTAPLGSYTYSVPSPQLWGPGTDYVYTGPSCPVSCMPTLTGANPTASENVPFGVIYQLTMVANPLGAGTIVANPTNSPGAPAGWFFANVSPVLTETPIPPNAFIDWTGFSCAPNCANPSVAIQMVAPETATANYLVPLTMSFSSTSASASVGGQAQVTITVTGGSTLITMSTSLPLPSGLSVNFAPNPFPAAASPGQAVSMTVSVAPTAPYGVFTFTVYATDVNLQQVSQIFTLTVIAPSVTTVGFSKTAYAMEFPSQSELIYTPANGGHWIVFYSDGNDIVYRVSTDVTGTAWSGSTVVVAGAQEGYSFSVVLNAAGTTLYYAYVPPTFPNYFEFNSGTIQPSGTTVTINWAGLPTNELLNPPPGLIEWATGSPSLMIDTSAACPGCVWIAVPALDTSMTWHMQFFQYNPPTWIAGKDVAVNALYGVGSSPSSAHAQMLQLTDGVALMFSVGNKPQLPTVYVIDHLDTGVVTHAALGGGMAFFEQQSQAVAVGDQIYFAGLATNNIALGATVQFFIATYTPSPGVGACGGGPIVCFSAVTPIPVIGAIPPNAIVNHSWHITLNYLTSQSAIFISWGVDGNVYFSESTDQGVSWTSPIALNGVNALVNGLTSASSGSTVGLAWVEQVGKQYEVRFAIV